MAAMRRNVLMWPVYGTGARTYGMRHASLSRRVGAEGYRSIDWPDIVGKALAVLPVGKARVLVRAPGGDGPVRTKEKFYRVWSDVSDSLKTIGRLYPDGKFSPLKTARTEEIMRTRGWRTALKDLQNAVLAHRIMSE